MGALVGRFVLVAVLVVSEIKQRQNDLPNHSSGNLFPMLGTWWHGHAYHFHTLCSVLLWHLEGLIVSVVFEDVFFGGI